LKDIYSTANLKVAAYFRLSRDDGDKLESDSITNQRLLVSEYVDNNDIQILEEYIDDGYTGSNFDRPDFQRMLNDIENGKINCIIIKDFSRLGRNYIEMGKLMNNYLPALGVRLISVNDNYDSIKELNASDEIVIPFKNLINDAYCRDISMKVRSQLDNKRKNGQFIGAFAAYGYIKDENNHNHLVIDETASEVVQLIYNMKLDGFSTIRIASKLNEMSIPTPYEYKRMLNPDFNNGFRAGYSAKWGQKTVDRILKNEVYTGVLIQGKRRKINYKLNKITDVGSSKWYRTENAHDAIIPKSIFDYVQKLFGMDTRTAPDEDRMSLFSGFLKCADCGQNMIRRAVNYKEKKYIYYHCSTYAKEKNCTSHNISEVNLQDAVVSQIKHVANIVKDSERIIRQISAAPDDRVSIKLINSQMESVLNEIKRYENMKVKLYMDFKDGLFDSEEFSEMNDNFSNRINRQKESFEILKNKKEKLSSLSVNCVPWINVLLEKGEFDSIDRRFLLLVVDSIVIYDKDRIEVIFANNDDFCELMKVVDDIKAREAIA